MFAFRGVIWAGKATPGSRIFDRCGSEIFLATQGWGSTESNWGSLWRDRKNFFQLRSLGSNHLKCGKRTPVTLLVQTRFIAYLWERNCRLHAILINLPPACGKSHSGEMEGQPEELPSPGSICLYQGVRATPSTARGRSPMLHLGTIQKTLLEPAQGCFTFWF